MDDVLGGSAAWENVDTTDGIFASLINFKLHFPLCRDLPKVRAL